MRKNEEIPKKDRERYPDVVAELETNGETETKCIYWAYCFRYYRHFQRSYGNE